MAEITAEIPLLPEEESWEKKEAEYIKQIDNLKKLNERLINYSEEKSKKFEHDLQKVTSEKVFAFSNFQSEIASSFLVHGIHHTFSHPHSRILCCESSRKSNWTN